MLLGYWCLRKRCKTELCCFFRNHGGCGKDEAQCVSAGWCQERHPADKTSHQNPLLEKSRGNLHTSGLSEKVLMYVLLLIAIEIVCVSSSL